MEQFFQRMHVRKQSLRKQSLSKKDQWKGDESDVRHGSCEFSVKYMGYTEVHESKGTDICKQSFHKLIALDGPCRDMVYRRRNRSASISGDMEKYDELGFSLAHVFQKNRRRPSATSHHYATLQISSEGIRILDENDDIIVETPIAAISFCCPNSQHERGFTYICRGEVPWKWHCHAMEAVEDLGERLNHAVGCAFTLCLEKKILSKRQNVAPEVPSVKIEYDPGTSGNPAGDFRKLSITDRQIDPQASLVADSVPRKCSDTTVYASVDRPRAPAEFKDRKGSLGGLMEAHPYKRQLHDNVAEEEVELRNTSDA